MTVFSLDKLLQLAARLLQHNVATIRRESQTTLLILANFLKLMEKTL